MLDFQLENELKPFLSHDDKLVWVGKPKTGIMLRASDAMLIPFSLLWGGFAVFWETMVITTGAPMLFKLFGIPFVLIGLYMIIGRFFADAWKRSKTVYGITNDRIIIKSGLFSSGAQSLMIKSLQEISLKQKGDGSGSILFGPVAARNFLTQSGQWPFNVTQTGLEFIMDVKQVYDKILFLQKQA